MTVFWLTRILAQAPQRVGEHAIVVGASIAGLLAARVLSESFDQVTVLDRDALPQLSDNRHGVPQGHHPHLLQLRGHEVFERLFPCFTDEALRAGAPAVRVTTDLRLCIGGHRLPGVQMGLALPAPSRPLLESLVRRRVRALANVTVRDRCSVLSLICEGGSVGGVQAQDRAAGRDPRMLRADLVVAATGRGGRVPAWLESMGYERPVEERVDIDIGYASRHLRLRPGALGTDKTVYTSAMPGRPRGMALVAEEGDRCHTGLLGYGAAHHPPNDDAGWMAFVATVADPDVLAAIADAEPLSEIMTHAFPANLRRRYDRLRRFPEGLLVLGDALCSFNPVYGQGMAVAALEAVALQQCLQDGDSRLAQRFFKAANVPVNNAWKLATGADFALPEVQARGPLTVRLANRYIERLLGVAERDEEVARTFIEVLGMLVPPTRLLRPATSMRVLRGTLRRGPDSNA
jgi:2-polyprenyl-6-methoxyphenol hydroxylase-like FAD-dependent oxidoreductase